MVTIFSVISIYIHETFEIVTEEFDLQYKYNTKLKPYFVSLAKINPYLTALSIYLVEIYG